MLSVLQSARTIRRAAAGIVAGDSFYHPYRVHPALNRVLPAMNRDGANNRTDLAKLGLAMAMAMTAAVLALIVACVRRWHAAAAGAMQRGLRLSQQQERCYPHDDDGQALFACAHDKSDPKS